MSRTRSQRNHATHLLTRRQRQFLVAAAEHAIVSAPHFYVPAPRAGDLAVVIGLAKRGYLRSYGQGYEITTWPRDILVTVEGLRWVEEYKLLRRTEV